MWVLYAEIENPPEDPVLDKFEEIIQYVDGRYEVALPWKNEDVKLNLVSNESNARKRLSVLNYKFEKNPNLKEEYHKVLEMYEQDNIIAEVPVSEMNSPYDPYPTYCMPHSPVMKDSVSSKVRPVFDAFAPGSNGVSLNNCLESGPSLIPDLVEIFSGLEDGILP